MLELLAQLALAYALGNLLGGRLMGRLRGVDLRAQGSGNIGATNAARALGWQFGLAVLAIDALKGVVAVLLIPRLSWPGTAAHELALWLPYACGLAVALGHCFPALHGFRGGKGVATALGVFAVLLPWGLPWMAASFLLVVLLTGIVSLATIAATAVALLYVTCFDARGLFSALGAFTLAMTLLIVAMHRDNLARLLAGTERRFERARVLGRALERALGSAPAR